MFLSISKEREAAIVFREEALQFIKENGLMKVTLGSFYSGTRLYLTLGHQHDWAWDTTLIRSEFNQYNICFELEKLQFYAAPNESFPLFVLKEGWGRAVIVCPTTFKQN